MPPIRICVCGAPGLSTSDTSRRTGGCTGGSVAGVAVACERQLPKLDSRSGITLSATTSPTTIRALVAGRKTAAYCARRSATENAVIVVAEPTIEVPYRWVEPYTT